MKYEDYKIDDMVFMNKEDWTDEEKREVIDTFPESRGWEEKIEALKQLKIDIDNRVIKKNRYGELNGISTKAYAKRHELFYYKSEYEYGYPVSSNDALLPRQAEPCFGTCTQAPAGTMRRLGHS